MRPSDHAFCKFLQLLVTKQVHLQYRIDFFLKKTDTEPRIMKIRDSLDGAGALFLTCHVRLGLFIFFFFFF